MQVAVDERLSDTLQGKRRPMAAFSCSTFH
jgi:hypothetical protein